MSRLLGARSQPRPRAVYLREMASSRWRRYANTPLPP